MRASLRLRAVPWFGWLLCVLWVVAIHDDFGPTWDEGVQDRYGRMCVSYFSSGFVDQSHASFLDLRFYGAFVELLLIAFRGGGPVDFDARHLGLGLLSALTVPALILLCRPYVRMRVAVLACLVLWCSPRFLGHAFNNSKDAPFLLAVTFYMAALLHFLAAERTRLSRALLLGLALGLALAVRPGGMPLLGLYGIVAAVLARVLRVGWLERAPASLRPAAPGLLLAGAVAWGVLVAGWPWAHAQPLLHPLEAVVHALRFHTSYDVLFAGHIYRSDALPASYLPTYLVITTPLACLAVLLLGAVPLVRRLRDRPDPREALLLLLATVWLVLPVLLFVLWRPNVYDGMRHFLFVLPALAVLVAACATEVAELLATRLRHGALAWALTAGVLLAPAVWQSVRIHPYQSSWFNPIVGGLRGASEAYQVDYWATATREGIEWLNAQATSIDPKRPLEVVVGVRNAYPWEGLLFYASSRVHLHHDGEPGATDRADYYLGPRRDGMMRRFPDAPIAHVVERDGVPLAVIKDLRAAPEPRSR